MINEEIFSEYVADPAAIRATDSSILEAAIEKYPYCQLLHAFHVKSLSGNSDIPQDLLFKAALLSPDRKVLWKIVHQGESIRDKNTALKSAALLAAAELGFIKEEGLESNTDQTYSPDTEPVQQASELADETSTNSQIPEDPNTEASIESDDSSKDSLIQSAESTLSDSEQASSHSEDQDKQDSKELQEILDNEVENNPTEEAAAEIQTSESIHQDEVPETTADEIQEILDADVNELSETRVESEVLTAESIHQEEERDIASAEIQDIITPDLKENSTDEDNLNPSEEALFVPEFADAKASDLIKEETVEDNGEGEISENSSEISESHDLDNLIKAGIAQNYSLEENSANDKPLEEEKPTVTETSETQDVSRYTDDKMPYSFLWWLDKTRREHTQNYQPYTSNFKLDTSKSISRNAVDPLSSQIIENIFHLQSPVDQLENSPRTVAFQIKRKGDYILEKFIREEPQIKPPDSQKLDTENKARKSSEDPNDLVSETLAQIYTDQMLYHKAIETFKKLSLKFPEKSTYFADQIIDLEKKLN